MVYFIPATELTGVPNGTMLTTLGSVTATPMPQAFGGTAALYLENTTDTAFSKSSTWATAVAPMTQVVSAGNYATAAGATGIDLLLDAPFTYTGGGLYVALDYVGSTFSSTPATYAANSNLVGSCESANSATDAPTTLGSTAFRPTTRLLF